VSDALELSVQDLDVRTDAAAWDAARLLLQRSLQAWEEGQEPIVYHLNGATLRIAEHIGNEGDAQRRATWLMQTIPRPGGVGLVYGIMLGLLYGGVAAGFTAALLPGLALADIRKALTLARKAKQALEAAGVNVPDPGTLVLQGIGDVMGYSILKGLKKSAIAIGGLAVAGAGAALVSPEARAVFEQIPMVGGFVFTLAVGGVAFLVNAYKQWAAKQ
jgi:hypothetical protein